MSSPRISNYAWLTGITIGGPSLPVYYVREMLAALALFSMVFLALGLVVLSVFFLWYAANRVTIWPNPASRAAIALFHRLVSQEKT